VPQEMGSQANSNARGKNTVPRGLHSGHSWIQEVCNRAS
jgi:hypothetical protein